MIDVDYNEYKKTIAENMELIVENHKLQKRIDKAIELCEEQFIDYEVNYLGKKNKRYAVIDAGKIIEILKGSDKE